MLKVIQDEMTMKWWQGAKEKADKGSNTRCAPYAHYCFF